jgi:hypothetical protein
MPRAATYLRVTRGLPRQHLPHALRIEPARDATQVRRSGPYRKLESSVAAMQVADHGLGDDATKPLDWSTDRSVPG